MIEPQPFIRTGLLHVPQFDAAAGEAVSQALIQSLRRVVIQQESYAAKLVAAMRNQFGGHAVRRKE